MYFKFDMIIACAYFCTISRCLCIFVLDIEIDKMIDCISNVSTVCILH